MTFTFKLARRLARLRIIPALLLPSWPPAPLESRSTLHQLHRYRR